MKKLMFLFLLLSSTAHAQEDESLYTFAIEGGIIGQTYNDIQIPNDASGSRFALDDVTGAGPFNAIRISLTRRLTARTELQLVLAPFTAEESGELKTSVWYNNVLFTPGDVSATYKFNTYRLSYRYWFRDTGRWKLAVGATGLIRDADVALEQLDTRTNYDNLGFVPLLNLRSEYTLSDSFLFLFDFNGLAGGPGRLLEGDARLQYDVSDRLFIGAGFRVLEGGADVDSVYNFAMLYTSYLNAGVRF